MVNIGKSVIQKNRSSHLRCSVKIDILKNFVKFTRKPLCLFFNKVAGAAWHKCFPMNFAKFLKISFSQNTSGWLLLKKWISYVVCLQHYVKHLREMVKRMPPNKLDNKAFNANQFKVNIPITQKLVNGFAMQISWLVFRW